MFPFIEQGLRFTISRRTIRGFIEFLFYNLQHSSSNLITLVVEVIIWAYLYNNRKNTRLHDGAKNRGELSYLAPLGSENISAPYFKQCFFRGGGWYYPPN